MAFALMYCNTDSSVVFSQDVAGPDGFADCPSCDMLDWIHSEQVCDLVGVFSEARRLLGIYSEMAEVSTCPAKDWSLAHQHADVVNIFLQDIAEASSKYRSHPLPHPHS